MVYTKFPEVVNRVYVVGYLVSSVNLLISLTILFCFRSLDCIRVSVHKGLFFSFVLSNTAWVVWHLTVINDDDVVQYNSVWCQILHIIAVLTMVANYNWMLCESVILHYNVNWVDLSVEQARCWYLSLGWGLSFVIVMVYALHRKFATADTDECWLDYSDSFYLIRYPVGLTLCISLMILIYVLFTLVSTHRAQPTSTTAAAIKKVIRAACCLIPLFGLHFMIIPLRPLSSSPDELTCQVTTAVITSLQGVWISILYCFTNGEVIAEFKIIIARGKRLKAAIAFTEGTREEFSRPKATQQCRSN